MEHFLIEPDYFMAEADCLKLVYQWLQPQQKLASPTYKDLIVALEKANLKQNPEKLANLGSNLACYRALLQLFSNKIFQDTSWHAQIDDILFLNHDKTLQDLQAENEELRKKLKLAEQKAIANTNSSFFGQMKPNQQTENGVTLK